MALPKSPQKRASMAFLEVPDGAGQAPKVAATVLMQRKVLGEVYYFIEVSCEQDGRKGHFLRTYEDFVALDARLKDSVKNMGGAQCYGEAASLRTLGELPTAEKFGFRRRMSQIGLTDFNSERSRKLQDYLNSMLSQLPFLREEPIFAEWLGDVAVIEAGREPAAVTKLTFLAKRLAKEFTPRTAEECEAEPIYDEDASVRVVGLQNTTEFNNMLGVVQCHDIDVDQIKRSIDTGETGPETSALRNGRYTLRMVDGQMVNAKAINVRLMGKELSDIELAFAVQAEMGSSAPKRASVAELLGLADS